MSMSFSLLLGVILLTACNSSARFNNIREVYGEQAIVSLGREQAIVNIVTGEMIIPYGTHDRIEDIYKNKIVVRNEGYRWDILDITTGESVLPAALSHGSILERRERGFRYGDIRLVDEIRFLGDGFIAVRASIIRNMTTRESQMEKTVFELSTDESIIPFGKALDFWVYDGKIIANVWHEESRSYIGGFVNLEGNIRFNPKVVVPFIEGKRVHNVHDGRALLTFAPRGFFGGPLSIIDLATGEVMSYPEYYIRYLHSGGLALTTVCKERLCEGYLYGCYHGKENILMDIETREVRLILKESDFPWPNYFIVDTSEELAVIRYIPTIFGECFRGYLTYSLIDLMSGETLIPFGEYDRIHIFANGYAVPSGRGNDRWEFRCIQEVRQREVK